MAACNDHARHLLESAKGVQAAGHPRIVYRFGRLMIAAVLDRVLPPAMSEGNEQLILDLSTNSSRTTATGRSRGFHNEVSRAILDWHA
jgi:hypothetical protein